MWSCERFWITDPVGKPASSRMSTPAGSTSPELDAVRHNRRVTIPDALRDIPEQTDPLYGKKVRQATSELSDEELESIHSSPQCQPHQRFAAFYSLQARRRQQHDYRKHREAVEEFRACYEDREKFPLFPFMIAESYGDVTADDGSRSLAIQYAREAVRLLPNTPGVRHLLAEYLLESVELGSSVLSSGDAQTRLEEAEGEVSTAIALDAEYAKYYATKSRILSQLGSDVSALEFANKAILLEDGTQAIGQARIESYRTLRTRIISDRAAKALQREQASAVAEFRGLRGELLSLLGLLAAVIALISTAASSAMDMDFPEGLSMMLASGSVIILIFLSFVTIFGRPITKNQVILPTSLSLLLGMASIAIHFIPLDPNLMRS